MKASPTQRLQLALKPIIDYCASHPGSKARIIERLNKLCPADSGKEWNRQQVESWLAGKNEPRLGAGLGLIESAKQIMEDK